MLFDYSFNQKFYTDFKSHYDYRSKMSVLKDIPIQLQQLFVIYICYFDI